MGILSRMRKQTAVYWPPMGDYDNHGQPLYGDPVELEPPNGVRWEETHEQFLDSQGQTQISRAVVFAGQDLQVGGLLRLGELAEVRIPGDPRARENGDVLEIRKFEKVPNLRASEFLRVAML